MGYGKYTQKEKEIVRNIFKIERKMIETRKNWLDLDVKRLALIHELKGKFKTKRRIS